MFSLSVVKVVSCFLVSSRFRKTTRPWYWLVFSPFIWKKWSRLFAPTKWLVRNRDTLTKRNSTEKVKILVKCTKNIALLVRFFFLICSYIWQNLYAKAIADNVWIKELLIEWIFYKIPSTGFSVLWDQMAKTYFCWSPNFFARQRSSCLLYIPSMISAWYRTRENPN